MPRPLWKEDQRWSSRTPEPLREVPSIIETKEGEARREGQIYEGKGAGAGKPTSSVKLADPAESGGKWRKPSDSSNFSQRKDGGKEKGPS